MKQKKTNPLLGLRRVEALFLAAGTIWAVAATAGSETASAAGSALLRALPMKTLKWELGDRRDTPLSPEAALVLGESPLLCGLQLQQTVGEEEEPAPVEEDPVPPPAPPKPETPPVPDTAPLPDNGVPARTLLPTNAAGYLVHGPCYISSSRKTPLPDTVWETPRSTYLDPKETGPQILIVHTHGSEAYTPAGDADVVWSGDHRSTDTRYSVVRVGDEMAKVFGEAGISVLHDRTLYDYPSYSGSYDRSLEGIQKHLKAHPSIRFILDVHRDAIGDSSGQQYKVVSEAEGAAQMTLVVGSDGSGAPHPNWPENLRLAAALQSDLLDHYPTLMRPMLLRNSRYNQHAAPGALLVEVGAAGNSPEEAQRAGRLFAQRMAVVIQPPKP